jgi:transposase-like protein
MTREQMSARWIARWKGCRNSGQSMSEYARQEGFGASSAYRWLRKARRSGVWSEEPEPGKAIAVAKTQPVQFARVAVSDTPRSQSSMLLRVVLTNGRRAELELGSIAHLGEVLDVLEQRP